MPRKPSTLLCFDVPDMEEIFKAERTEWRNARKTREKREARNRERGTGNRLDGLCHINSQPCTRAAKCDFRCVEVCQNITETFSAFYCANAKSCAKEHPRTRFVCGLRNVHTTD